MKSGRKSEAAINEGILKVMADLKIDTNITREVSLKVSFTWNNKRGASHDLQLYFSNIALQLVSEDKSDLGF